MAKISVNILLRRQQMDKILHVNFLFMVIYYPSSLHSMDPLIKNPNVNIVVLQ
jgi:hypothetical protein